MQHAIAIGSLVVVVAALPAQISWVQRTPPAAYYFLAYDVARARTVAFASWGTGSITWERDGNRWIECRPAIAPPSGSIAYDWARARTVLHRIGSTWEWDGTSWTVRTVATAPSVDGELSFDIVRARTVFVSSGTAAVETWEWDGSRWTKIALATAPAPPAGRTLAYDLLRQRTLLFGRDNELWAYDGSSWTMQTPAGPRPTRGLALSYDLARGVAVLVTRGASGFDFEAWEWNGAIWSKGGVAQISTTGPTSPAACFDFAQQRTMVLNPEVHASTTLEQLAWDGTRWSRLAPPPERMPVMAYDAGRGVTVFVAAGSLTGAATCSTYEWNESGWIERASQTQPPKFLDAQLVYDRARRRCILFAGSPSAQTWEWDGTNWSLRAPAIRPGIRTGCGFAYDSVRRRAVLFGGAGLNETWEWDGTAWTQRAPATSPPALIVQGMAFDAARGRTVLVGFGAGIETWEWDGSNWLRRITPSTPDFTQTYGAAMAFDSARARMVFSGISPSRRDLWEYDGVDWRGRIVFGGTAGLAWYGFAFDEARGRCVVSGGVAFIWPRDDTVELVIASDEIGPGHATVANPIRCTTPPQLGQPLGISFANPTTGAAALLLSLGTPALPAPVSSVPQLCAPMLVYPQAQGLLALPVSGDPALFGAIIPNDPLLRFVPLTFQGLALRAGGACLEATNGLYVRVQ